MREYFATVARGIELLAAKELESLGASSVNPDFCGVSFKGDRQLLYKVNLWARLPFRILVKIDEFVGRDAKELYRGVQNIDWQQYLTPDRTLAVSATGKNDSLNHTHFTALQVKNAIVDRQMEELGERSNIDPKSPDVKVNVHIRDDRCIISLDSSASSLHRRGYRPAVGVAPLKESLAAALIKLSGWEADVAFFDPLCGSGTLPLEASLQALNIAPGLFRPHFGFQNWPDFDRQVWDKLVGEANLKRQERLKIPIMGSDRSEDALEVARTNADLCGVEKEVKFIQAELEQVEPPSDRGLLLCNPPYGKRIGNPQQLGKFYKLLGNVLKQRFKNWTAFILSGNKELAKNIGLKSSKRIPVYNGTIQCQLMKYELY